MPGHTFAGASRRDERGFGFLITLLMLVIVSTVATAAARLATVELAVTANYKARSGAFYAADGSSQAGVDELVRLGRSLGRFPTDAELAAITPPTMTTATLSEFALVRDGVEVIEPLQSGYFQGLNAYTMPFATDVTAETSGWPVGRATVGLDVLFDIIPLFQFAVFYDEDLEIQPGPNMLLNGRVHSNADVYLNAGAALSIDSVLTAAGNIYHRRKDKNASLGTVQVRDAAADFIEFDGFDSDDADWYAEALSRWDGNVRSSEHGIERLNMTVADATDPRMYIRLPSSSDSADEQASKLSHQAGLLILNGEAVDALGNPVSTVDPVSGDDAIRATVIFDPREQADMLTLELDMEKLGRSAAWPANGLIYVGSAEDGDLMPTWGSACVGCWGPEAWKFYQEPWTDPDTKFAVKVANGAELASAVTVATDNPLYVRGDYNIVNKIGAALMADAITVLSDDWGRTGQAANLPDEDLAYSQLAVNSRVAANTELNAALMLGNTETFWGSYNGGLENVLRFLEKWSGRTLEYTGSIIDLWYSEQATGSWKYGSPVYTAPARDWAFDTDFLDVANLPPFTPRVYTVRVSDWRQE